MDERYAHVVVCVFLMTPLEALCGVAEPVDLVLLDPVVSLKLTLVRRVRVRVEQVDSDGRVARAAAGQNLYVVVAHPVNAHGARLGERVGELFDKLHL